MPDKLRSQREIVAGSEVVQPRPPVVKFEHPKILTVDTESTIAAGLLRDGYNVAEGTFGGPYKVKKHGGYEPVIVDFSLPGLIERDILIIDLEAPKLAPHPPGEKMVPNEDMDWWAKCGNGVIDPRPRTMLYAQESIQKILSHGGCLIVFAEPRDQQDMFLGRMVGHGLDAHTPINDNNWSFLPDFQHLQVEAEHGEEITAAIDREKVPELARLSEFLEDATFNCVLNPTYTLANNWQVLAVNKYGATVAAAIVPSEDSSAGWVFILPRANRQYELVSTLIRDVLPEICPKLFPNATRAGWTRRAEYELPAVLALAHKKEAIQKEAEAKILEIDAQILAQRTGDKFLYTLIEGTGDELVQAVLRALNYLGFKSVVDVDEIARAAGNTRALREDIQILDRSPTLIVDVKGVNGTPADAEALQAQKHTLIFIRENKRHDVSGLTIINHQKSVPPLDRENDMPFRQEILHNAEQLGLGLLTGWDLFRLVRGMRKNSWTVEQVQPVFYRTGRIHPIPAHYQAIGTVKQVWPPAFSIALNELPLKVGDRIAIEFPVDFYEQDIESIQVNNESVKVSEPWMEVGVKRSSDVPKPKVGMVVYKISEP